MKAITLWQPYASLIAEGIKRTETRNWKPPASIIGTDIAIHAAMRWTRDEKQEAAYFSQELRELGPLPLGKVVAVVSIKAIYSTDGTDWPKVPEVMASYRYGDYSPGRYIWHLTNIRKVAPPFIFTGRQRFFHVPDRHFIEDGPTKLIDA